jgi:hypothetical protein
VVAAPDVVDEHVEAAVDGADPVHERRHVCWVAVIAAHGDPFPAGGGDALRGFLDGFGPVQHRAAGAGAAAAAIHRGAERSELDGDGAAAPARGTRDESDTARERLS